MNSYPLPELLVPAGSLSKLRFALAYGADAVYVGAAGFSMRPDAASFDREALIEAVNCCHEANRRLYVAINTLMFQRDVGALETWLEATRQLDFDALIVSDPGALHLVRRHRPDVPLHISTQLSTANAHAARFWYDAGAERVILARECTLADARGIAEQSGVPVEVFVHGAMCVAVSGRCLLSAHLCGHSASLGNCKHSCRWEWQLVEEKRPGETVPVFETGRETVLLGSTDLCLIEHIPALAASGFAALKIEGRMKSEHYVAAVTRVYREALDAYAADPEGYTMDPDWVAELDSVSHRPYSEGFAFGYPKHRPDTLQTFNRPIGSHVAVAYVHRGADGRTTLAVKHPCVPGETLTWIGPYGQGGSVRIEALFDAEGGALSRAVGGTHAGVRLSPEQPELPDLAVLRRPRPS